MARSVRKDGVTPGSGGVSYYNKGEEVKNGTR